jgi:uncharacterized membrane protein
MSTGVKTTEFWVTTIGGVLIALLPLLVAYGVFTSEMADVWKGVIVAIMTIVVPPVIGSLAKNYATNRTELKLQETATALEVMRLEARD